MGREVVLFKSKEQKNLADISAFLHELADKVQTGQLSLNKGQEELPISLSESVFFEVEVEEKTKKRRGKQYSLEIELKWYDSDVGVPASGISVT